MQRSVHAGVLLLCAGAAMLSCRDALLAYWTSRLAEATDARRAPPAMPGWAARSPRIQLITDQAAFAADTLADDALPRVADNARAALLREPLEPTALYQLGMVGERRTPGAGKPLFDLAERLSRHEPLNELELEGLAVQRADNAGAIFHVDRAVLAAPELGNQIFPALAPAIADPAILKIIAHYADRPWYPGFIRQAMQANGDVDAIARLISTGSGHIEQATINEFNASLISMQIDRGNFAAAKRIADGLAPDIRSGLAGMGFSPVSTDQHLRPLSWWLPNYDAANTRFDPGSGLVVTASPEQSALVASRMTFLAAGTYSFVQTVVHDPSIPKAGIVWDVLCAGGHGPVIWHQPVSFGVSGRATIRATLSIPSGCGAQVWNMQVVGADGDSPSAVSIANLALQAQ